MAPADVTRVAGQTTVATLRGPFTIGRFAERVAVCGVAAAFILIAYSKMGERAEDTVAQGNLSAILPVVHAYAVEHGNYTGMTLEALQEGYSADLDVGSYVVIDRGAADFCIESAYAGRTWHISASRNDPSQGSCKA